MSVCLPLSQCIYLYICLSLCNMHLPTYPIPHTLTHFCILFFSVKDLPKLPILSLSYASTCVFTLLSLPSKTRLLAMKWSILNLFQTDPGKYFLFLVLKSSIDWPYKEKIISSMGLTHLPVCSSRNRRG